MLGIGQVLKKGITTDRTAIPMSVKHCGWDPETERVDYSKGCGGFDISDSVLQAYIRNKNIPEAYARCSCKTAHEIETDKANRRVLDANIPNQSTPKRFDNFTPVDGSEETVLALKDFIDGKGKILMLAGVVGSGKSHLLEATARRLFSSGVRVRYIEWANYMDELRKAEMNNTKYDLYERYELYNTLILDDVGVGRSKEYTSEELTKIFENRFTQGTVENHRLIISTNLNYKEMSQQFDDRIASRLWQNDSDLYRKVVMQSKDFRIKSVA